ncbi:MAG TPA: TIGR03118 family protein [Jatrophihabitantaceae bacterium]
MPALHVLHARHTAGRAALAVVAVGATVAALVLPSAAAASGPARRAASTYRVDKLVADTAAAGAKTVDAQLVNPWGLSAGPSTPLWVSDNGTDVTTVYSGGSGGTAPNKVLTVGTPGGAPTGQVFNDTNTFKVGGTPATFIFAGEHGDITAWNGGANAVKKAHTKNAVYKGLALTNSPFGPLLLAANFHAGSVDVFNGSFQRLHVPRLFDDTTIPNGFAPFNVAVFGKTVYVAYAKQDAEKTDDVPGAGNGFIDTYTTYGAFLGRFTSHGDLNSPWGMVIAPAGFGDLTGDLLVGNFGDGRIHAYDPSNAMEVGTLQKAAGKPITIDGLWGLLVGNSAAGGANAIWFSAGPDHEAHGLLGTLTLKS